MSNSILMKTKRFNKIFKKRIFSETSNFKTKFVLIIPYKSENFSRITIYPVDNIPILKLTIQSNNEKNLICFLQKLSEQLNKKIIHSTGLVKKSNFFCQTLYIEDDKKSLEEYIISNNKSITQLGLNIITEWISNYL